MYVCPLRAVVPVSRGRPRPLRTPGSQRLAGLRRCPRPLPPPPPPVIPRPPARRSRVPRPPPRASAGAPRSGRLEQIARLVRVLERSLEGGESREDAEQRLGAEPRGECGEPLLVPLREAEDLRGTLDRGENEKPPHALDQTRVEDPQIVPLGE